MSLAGTMVRILTEQNDLHPFVRRVVQRREDLIRRWIDCVRVRVSLAINEREKLGPISLLKLIRQDLSPTSLNQFFHSKLYPL